ncbi:MAG: NAD(P)/FAD-dependent oxidoreductase [Pseudomonadota bacterium]|nr:NAD(P)/FAD-dependent oxidoreductase [Pseudomonadota bacterium]
MTETVDCVVIGAGVIGLAVARRLALAGREVIVLEKAEGIGTETSSRNSEVIHAGLYYPTGSLKAKLCVAGNLAMYRYCAEHHVPHKRLSKVIVATNETEIVNLEKYIKQAQLNGVHDLVWLTPAEVCALEPNVRCVAALHSPSTGLVDSHALMLAYQGDLENGGGMIVFHSPIESGEVTNDGVVLNVGGKDPMTIQCKLVVNCAGLYAQDIAKKILGVPAETIPPIYYAIGHYFTVSGKPAFTRLIYPVAVAGSLGLHVALDLAGQVRFGPDIEYIDRIDYSFRTSLSEKFYESIRRYYPDLKDDSLQPGYTGIRPKLHAAGTPAADFVIQGRREHGVHGLINLYGIESPGLTSSLAIADYVHQQLKDQ